MTKPRYGFTFPSREGLEKILTRVTMYISHNPMPKKIANGKKKPIKISSKTKAEIFQHQA